MKRLLTAVFLISIAAPAGAQVPQRKFVPFTVDEKTAQELQAIINEVPTKYGLPLLQWLGTQEQRAIIAEDQKTATPPAPVNPPEK